MTHTDTPTVDTSANTIAALLHDLYHSDMACALTHQAAQVIEALRADIGAIKGLTRNYMELSQTKARAETAEAEIARLTAALATSRAETAMAFEVAARDIDCGCRDGVCAFEHACPKSDVDAIRALTPADATAALAARDKAKDDRIAELEGERDAALAGAVKVNPAAEPMRFSAAIQPDTDSLQKRANDWVLACFGAESLMDKTERTHRFLEEALELAQACDCTKGEALQLVDYVFARDKGDVAREVGDVINTIAMLCTAHGIDMDDAGHKGLDRCWANIDKTRTKRAAKPSFSPLPVDTEAVEMAEAAAFSAGYEAGQRDEREACADLASVRADSLDDAIKWGGGKVYLASLKGGLIELRNLAAAIRKRGESEG